MKNLAIFTIVLFSASISQAQISHDSDKEIYIKDNVAKSEPENVVMFIPMLGNVTIKNASYNFKQAIMPFQIEKLNNNVVRSKTKIEEDSISSAEATTRRILTAETEVTKD